MEITKIQRDLVDSVIRDFDFERVHKCMVAINFIWCNIESPLNSNKPRTPTLGEIILKAYELLEIVVSCGEDISIAFGGLEACYEFDRLSLRFVVEQSELEC